jgi:hypothetical protein
VIHIEKTELAQSYQPCHPPKMSEPRTLRKLHQGTCIAVVLVLVAASVWIPFYRWKLAITSKGRLRSTSGLLYVISSVAGEIKVEKGELREHELLQEVTRWLELRNPSFFLQNGDYATMLSRSEDAWGKKLRITTVPTNDGMLRVEMRSAGKNGRFDGQDGDDIAEVVYCTSE